MQTETEPKNGKGGNVLETSRPLSTESPSEQKKICPQPQCGCISVGRGNECSHNGPCEPVDENGNRFAFREWIEDGTRMTARDYPRPVAPVIESDAMNAALLAARNPREALIQIQGMAREARQDIRNQNYSCAFVKLNQIYLLTGGLS